jgi:hypothetical protein
MWIPKSLKVTRFMSHSETLYHFNQGVATMIYGENKDDEAQESNGSGKSVLIEGISMSFIGSPLRDVRPVELIMDGEDSLEVESTWFNVKLNREMKIWRSVPIKGSSKVCVYINGENQKDNIPTVRDADEFILDQLDITKEDLLNYFIISKEKYVSFFAFGDTKKKEVVARFSNANIVDPVFEAVKLDVLKFDNQLRLQNADFIRSSTKIEMLREQLAEPEKDQEAVRLENIAALEARKVAGKETLKKSKDELSALNVKLKSSQHAVDTFKTIDYSTQLAAIAAEKVQHEKDLPTLKAELKECDEFIHELKHIIAGTIECPSCKYQFVLGKDLDASQAAVLLPEAEAEYLTIKTSIDDITVQLNAIEEKALELRRKQRIQTSDKDILLQTVKTIERNILEVESSIGRYEKAIVGFEKEIDEEKAREIVDYKKPLRDQLKELEEAHLLLEKEVSKVEKEKAECVEWDHKFKRFKSHLANKAIASIETFTTYYLQQIKTNLGLKLSGYKVKANGELSEKISATIMRNGLEVASFGRFSGGEKVRVEICNILALQGLINLNSKNGGLDLLCLDEIIESVDGKGVTELMKALNLLNKTVLVITHTSHAGVYDHVVTVVKEKGFSKIVA